MKIHHDATKDVFSCESTIDERAIPKSLGFWWSKDFCPGKWAIKASLIDRFVTPPQLAKWAEFVTPEALPAYERVAGIKAAKVEAIAESRASTAEIELPCPEGLSYLPFQRAGIKYGLDRFAAGRTGILIGDEMGLGKTIQALGVASGLATLQQDRPMRVVVVCPASLRLNWAREAAKWLVGRWRVMAHLGVKKIRTTRDDCTKPGEGVVHQLVIVNYDILGKVELRNADCDLLITDEAHYLKNEETLRAKAVAGIKASRRVVMTGTPIVNRPKELWNLLQLAAPDVFNNFNFWRYAKRYCNAHKKWIPGKDKPVWDLNGASHLDELQEELRASCMVRRLKADVLTELPPKRRALVVIPSNGATQAIEDEMGAWGGSEFIERLEVAAEIDGGYEALVSQMRGAGKLSFEEISEIRRNTAIAKIPHVVEHVETALTDNDNCIVVMAHHKEVVAGIAAGLAEFGVVTLTGDNSPNERQKAVDDFQAGKARVFIGTIMAAGVGLTLTRSAHVVFAELDWVPGNVSQAEDRCHRIGQRDHVLVEHLVFEGSIDAHLAKIIIAKQEVITAALDTEKVHAAVNVPSPEHLAAKRAARTAAEKAVDVAITEHRQVIIAALRFMDERCDGAVHEDGQGFNGRDAGFGKRLAQCSHLSDRQAECALKMLKTYKNTQLPRDMVAKLWPVAKDGEGVQS